MHDEWDILNLDSYEAEHHQGIEYGIGDHLRAAEDGAEIALKGIASASQPPLIDQPDGHAYLLVAKSAKNVRFAVKGLRIGYYSGAAGVLRSALEDLEHAVILLLQPHQLAKWCRNEFADMPFGRLCELREDYQRDARMAFFSEEKDPKAIGDGVREFVNRANWLKHSTTLGLVEEYGIPLEYLVPEELEEAFRVRLGDTNEALNEYIKRVAHPDRFPPRRSRAAYQGYVPVEVTLVGRYDARLLWDLALIAFFVAHRLLDYASDAGWDLGEEF